MNVMHSLPGERGDLFRFLLVPQARLPDRLVNRIRLCICRMNARGMRGRYG
jgi:hypothetical protein